MMTAISDVLKRLPPEIVTGDQDIIGAYTTDFRRQYSGRSEALLRPRTTEDVQEIVRRCADFGVPVVPQGGNTGYCAAATPDSNGTELIVSFERMNRIRELDAANLSVCADAGVVLSTLQETAANAGFLLPLALGSQQSCRIGGNLSTNAGGLSVLRYGMARDLVLGLEAVLPDGSLFSELSPLRKNNAGYDVKQLFIGSEGTLGIITAASLKLKRKPRQTITAFLAIPDIASLATILDLAQVQTGEAITSFEYISESSLQLLLNAKPELRRPLQNASAHYVLLEAATASPVLSFDDAVTSLLEDLLERGLATDGTIAASGQQSAELWSMRENIPEAEVHHGGSVKHDIAVRTSHLADFIEGASNLVRLKAPDAVLSVYGHVGDGNVHFNVLASLGADAREFKRRFEVDTSPLIYEFAASMGGTFSAEYGIGRTKLDLMANFGAQGKVEIMRLIKNAVDPKGIMNPGKVIPERR